MPQQQAGGQAGAAAGDSVMSCALKHGFGVKCCKQCLRQVVSTMDFMDENTQRNKPEYVTAF